MLTPFSYLFLYNGKKSIYLFLVFLCGFLVLLNDGQQRCIIIGIAMNLAAIHINSDHVTVLNITNTLFVSRHLFSP